MDVSLIVILLRSILAQQKKMADLLAAVAQAVIVDNPAIQEALNAMKASEPVIPPDATVPPSP